MHSFTSTFKTESVLLPFLAIALVSCAAREWQTKKYASIAAEHKGHSGTVEFHDLLGVLDGLAQLLYADGFVFESNDPQSQPAKIFSRDYRTNRGDYSMQTPFVLIEAPTAEVRCTVEYDSKKTVWITFDQFRVTSITHPRFPMSLARRLQIASLVDRIGEYLRRKLPSYHITVSDETNRPNQAMQRTAPRSDA
jgi:hypothetical protein